MRPVLDEVGGPQLVAMFRAQPDARAVREPQAPAFRLFVGNLQPLTPPDAFDPLVIHEPACISQQRGDLAIAVPTVLAGQFDDIGGQPILVLAAGRHLALRRAMLTERRAGATLGDMKLTSDMLDANASACGA